MERIEEKKYDEQFDNENRDEQLKNRVMRRYSKKEIPSDDGGKRNIQRVELSFEIPNKNPIDKKTVKIARCEIVDKLKNGIGKEKAGEPKIEFNWVEETDFGGGKESKILPPYIASHLFKFAQCASKESLIEEIGRLREMYVFGCEQDAKIYDAFGGEEGWFRAKTDEVLKDQGTQIGKITIAPSLDTERRVETEKLLRLGRKVAMEKLYADFFSLYGAPDGEFKAVQFAYALVSNTGLTATELWEEYRDKKEKANDKMRQPGMASA